MSALFLPVLMIFFFLGIPMGLFEIPDFNYIKSLLDPWVVRLILGGIIGLSFFHWAHRFRFTLYEGLQLHRHNFPIAVLCYGSAMILNAFLVFILFIY